MKSAGIAAGFHGYQVMTEHRSALRKTLPHLARTFAIWAGRIAMTVREFVFAPAPSEAGHDVVVSYRPGARALSADRQLYVAAMLGGAVLLVTAIILGLSALLATHAVGLIEDDTQSLAASTFRPTIARGAD
jgi:hypothetical protein